MSLDVQHKNLHQPNTTPTEFNREDLNSQNYHGLSEQEHDGTNPAFSLYGNPNRLSIGQHKQGKRSQNAPNNTLKDNYQFAEKGFSHESIDALPSGSNLLDLQAFETFGKQREGRKEKAPTFGDDQLNEMLYQQQVDPVDLNKEKPGKIERMLQEHKKKKIIQSIMSMQQNGGVTHEYPQAHYRASEEYYQGQEAEPTFGTRVQENEHYTSSDQDLAFAYEGTGRFGGPTGLSHDFNDDLSSFKEDRSSYTDKQQSDNNTNKANGSSSRRKGNSGRGDTSGKNYVPKISENSQKIMRNSQRAKEDEEIIKELVAANMLKAQMRNSNNSDGRDNLQLQNIPEENEESNLYDRNRLGNSAKMTLQQKLQKVHGGFITKGSSESVSNVSNTPSPINRSSANKQSDQRETVSNTKQALSPGRSTQKGKGNFNTSKSQILNDSHNQSTPASKNSKGQRYTWNQQRSPTGISAIEGDGDDVYSSPSVYSGLLKSIPSATVIEHKKALPYEQVNNNPRKISTSPTRKEIKELANMTKSIYVRVVQNKNSLDENDVKNGGFKKALKKAIKSHPIVESAEFAKKLAEKQNKIDLSYLTAEELKRYDEVQRLEIMLQNLKQIQRSNLMDSEKKGEWNNYADSINGNALERRTTRKTKVEEKEKERALRTTKSFSPEPMEKIDPSLESLLYSAQLRQQMFPKREGEQVDDDVLPTMWRSEDGQIKSWADMDMYERNMVWLLARNDKLNKMNLLSAENEMKPCSFKPTIYTKGFSSPTNKSKLESAYISQVLSERLPGDKDGLDVTGKTGYLKDKSLYQERKSLENYVDIFSLKKSFNLYKNELFWPFKKEGAEENNNQGDNDKYIPTDLEN